eukprot:gene17748-21167_t
MSSIQMYAMCWYEATFSSPAHCLAEGFCIAIVEAASCGLYVLSTKVGGVSEVLPPHMISLAQPKSDDLEEKLTHAMLHLKRTPSRHTKRLWLL